jgi:hypothetical protein
MTAASLDALATDLDPVVRERAVRDRSYRAPRASPTVALEDASDDVRASAAFAIGLIGPRRRTPSDRSSSASDHHSSFGACDRSAGRWRRVSRASRLSGGEDCGASRADPPTRSSQER